MITPEVEAAIGAAWAKQLQREQATPRERIIEFMSDGKWRFPSEVADELGLKHRTCVNYMAAEAREGRFERELVNDGTSYLNEYRMKEAN